MSPTAAVNSQALIYSKIGHQNLIQHNGHINIATRDCFMVRDCSNFMSKHNQSLVSSRTTCVHASASSSSSSIPEEWLDAKTKQRRKKIAGVDQEELLDPTGLAEPDSCFCEFNGVHIHHKVYDAQSQSSDSLQNQALIQIPRQTKKKIGFPMILLHGFAASVFSWSQVMKPLAEFTSSKVLAFDRPAFGFTSRLLSYQHLSNGADKKPLNPYSMAFSVLATLYFIDFLTSDKAIIVAHSAGSLVAVNTYFEAPERVAALILIAPAILAPRAVQKAVAKIDKSSNEAEKEKPDFNPMKPFIKIFKMLSTFIKYFVQALLQAVKGIADMINSLTRKALAATLRSAFAVMLLRFVIDKFGLAAVRSAFYDGKYFTEHVIEGYTKPLRVKDWDRSLLEFTATMLTDTEPASKPPLAKRLHEISCPVLIVTGDTDRLVPFWNAKRLARTIPGSKLEVIEKCGHLPHEEKAEEFVSVVENFLQNAFGCSEETMQAAGAI